MNGSFARIALIIFLSAVFIYYYAAFESKKDEASAPKLNSATILNARTEREKWQKKIEEIGSYSAYEEFKKENAGRDFSVQHLAGHVFGSLLYEKEGINGLTVCDAAFGFSCYHGFFTSAISEEGADSIKKLNDACVEKYGVLGTGCLHGIGHGIMEYKGHKALLTALTACSDTIQKHPLLGCTSGVFMEYNVPIEVSETSAVSQKRELDASDPSYPCPSLPEKFRESCWFEQTEWWRNFFEDEKMGELCDSLAKGREQERCLQGIGYSAVPRDNYNPDAVIERCKKMPVRDDEIICRSGASWGLFSVPETRNLAPILCEKGLSKKEGARCLEKTVYKELIGIKE